MNISEANEPLSTGLRVLIEKKGMKNLHVAKKAGYSPQKLSDMLNGRRLIKACDIPNLALALGVKIDDIYEAGKMKKWLFYSRNRIAIRENYFKRKVFAFVQVLCLLLIIVKIKRQSTIYSKKLWD